MYKNINDFTKSDITMLRASRDSLQETLDVHMRFLPDYNKAPVSYTGVVYLNLKDVEKFITKEIVQNVSSSSEFWNLIKEITGVNSVNVLESVNICLNCIEQLDSLSNKTDYKRDRPGDYSQDVSEYMTAISEELINSISTVKSAIQAVKQESNVKSIRQISVYENVFPDIKDGLSGLAEAIDRHESHSVGEFMTYLEGVSSIFENINRSYMREVAANMGSRIDPVQKYYAIVDTAEELETEYPSGTLTIWRQSGRKWTDLLEDIEILYRFIDRALSSYF